MLWDEFNIIVPAGILTWNVRQFAALEGQMIAVQRQLQFADIPSEALPVIHSCRPPPYWPSEGAIVVDNLVVRYSENDPPVLKGISCRIRPREKVIAYIVYRVCRCN